MAVGWLSTRKNTKVNRWREFAHLLLPSTCLLCGRRGQPHIDVCSECARELPYVEAVCRRCASPLSQHGVCGKCQQKQPSFDQVVAVFQYQEPVDHLIQALKFDAKLCNARLLGDLMAKRLMYEPRPDVMVPVPLHSKRLRKRGFNQAMELARPIAKALQIPLKADLCRRTRNTPSQTALDAAQRRRNLKNAFVIDTLNGVEDVVIVDDVMTTGSTVEAMARVFKDAGVRRVRVWCCARALPHS